MKYLMRVCAFAVLSAAASLPALLHLGFPGPVAAFAVLLFLVIQVCPSAANRKLPSRRLRICGDGCELLGLFLASVTASAVLEAALFFICRRESGWSVFGIC